MLRDDHVGEVPEVLRRPGRLPLRLGDRQPGVERLERGDLLAAGLDLVGDPVQDLRPRPRRQPGPRAALEGLRRGSHRPVDVGRVARRRLRVHLVRHRVGDVERAAAHARPVLAADEMLDLLGPRRRA